ncbi:MAG: hypothetical protein KDC87_10505, partial [Planctomycetes bacterium]|nr:hypothetical protein [Planctomycetota bacterium]
RRAVFTAVSDQAGIARVGGLRPGQYWYNARHPTRVKLRTHGDRRPVVPGPPTQMVFADVYAAVIRADGPIEWYEFVVRNQGSRVALGDCTGLAKLVAKYPAPGALVVATTSRAGGSEPHVHGLVLTARHGLTQMYVPMVPLERPPKPVDLVAKGGSPCHLVTLYARPGLVVPQGFRAPLFVIEGTIQGAKRRREFSTVAELNKPIALLPGCYKARPVFPHVVGGDAQPITFEADSTKQVEVGIREGLVPCRLKFAPAHADVPLGMLQDVSLSTADGTRVLEWSAWHEGDARYSFRMCPDQWLIPQRYVLRAQARGIGKEQLTIDVRNQVGTVQVLLLEFDGLAP